MARPEEAKVVNAMKSAKTAQEMVESWYTQRPGAERGAEEQTDPLNFYAKRKPEMIHTFAHNQLTQVLDRGILDPKTRYLIILACYMMDEHWRGILPQCCNAKAAGATEEEILETAFLACYAKSKQEMVGTGEALASVFANPVFKKIKTLA